MRTRCLRVLLELPDCPDEMATLRLANQIIARLTAASAGESILLHGEGASAWPLLRHALYLGLDTRVGLEDTLHLPDGRCARDNAVLVAHAPREARPAPAQDHASRSWEHAAGSHRPPPDLR